MFEDDNGPKQRKHDLGSEDGEMADILEATLDREVIYNHGTGQWHLFNRKSGLWLPDRVRDVPNRIDAIALEMIRMAAVEDSDLKRVKVFRKLREQSRIESAMKALSSRDAYKTDGSIFDTDPHLLGVRNGVIDLSTMTLYAVGNAARDLYVSRSAAVEWPADEQAAMREAEPFLAFVHDVLGGDDRLFDYVLRVLGYSLIGTSQEEKFWLLVGDGRNGKGTLTKFVHWLLGDYATFLDPSLYIRNRWGDPGADRARPEIGDLWGRRFAVTSEPVKGAFNEQMLKAHSGRDLIKFRRMRSDVMWTFTPTHKLFFLTQEAPAVEDVGPSMRARARVIRFEQSYVGREDQNLAAKLEGIGQGVLAILAHYASLYLREGLPENDKVLAWSEAYINENDPTSKFVAERCEVGRGLRAQAKLVYTEWQAWCAINGVDAGSSTKLGMIIGKRFKREHTRNGDIYLGLGLKGATEGFDQIAKGEDHAA